MYVWSYEAYQRWYKSIEDSTSDETIGIEAKFEEDIEIDISSWGT